MMRALGIVGLLVFAAAAHRVAVADEPKAGKAAPPDPTAQLLAKLRQPLALPASDELQLSEFAAQVEKATGVPVTINTAAFRTDGEGENVEGLGVRVSASKKLSGAVVLRHTLGRQGWTYLVRRDHVEIVPIGFALKESRQSVQTDANGDAMAAQPLVSAVVKNMALSAALDDLAADHDLTVILSPQAGDQKAAFVTARLLNVPADKAIELLALQADLRVVRRGPAFLVTTKEHADGLFNERHERERQKLELENMRNPGGVLGGPPGGAFCGFTGIPGVGNLGVGGRGNAGCVPGGQINGFGGTGINGFGFGSGFGGISGNGFGGSPAPATPPVGGR
ncbi:MAG TPA: hypothetical protein VD866_07065 [Urbifossiella sp.]|nr:hypothetical protein [Urbifossiella sp.]